MDPSRDNPLTRLSAFFWGSVTLVLFAIALPVLLFLKGCVSDEKALSLEDAAATKRYETRGKIDTAQHAALAYKEVEPGKKVQVPPQDVFEYVGKKLASTKAAAVEKPEQVVPNSPTAKKIADTPAADVTHIDTPAANADAPIDPAILASGKAQFMLCAACHGQNGEGTPAAPPLAGSEWVTGPASNLILIQLRGLTGPIKVKGQEYNMPGGMVAAAYQTDEQIAAVLTFVRNSFGNKAPAVTPDQVKALRGEVGKPQITAAELKQPEAPAPTK